MDEAVLVRVHVYLCWGMVLAFTVFWDYWWHVLTTSWMLCACLHIAMSIGMCVYVLFCALVCIYVPYAHISICTCMHHAYMSKHMYAWYSHALIYPRMCIQNVVLTQVCVYEHLCMHVFGCTSDVCMEAVDFSSVEMYDMVCMHMHPYACKDACMYACMHVCLYLCADRGFCSHLKLCAHVACTAHVHVTNEQVWMLPYMIVYLHDGIHMHSVTPAWPCACACVLLFMSFCCTHVLRSRQRQLDACMYIHMLACVYVRMHPCVRACAYPSIIVLCLFVGVHVCMYLCAYCVCGHVCKCTCVLDTCPHAIPSILQTQSCVCEWMFACAHVHVYVCRRLYTCKPNAYVGILRMPGSIHQYIHSCIHACIHTYIHIASIHGGACEHT
jgi:hypothetical protein